MLKPKFSSGFISLYSARMILNISGGLLGLFMPIFLYNLFGGRLSYVIFFYMPGYILYALTVAWGAGYLNRIGLRRSLRWSLVFGAVYYYFLYLADRGSREMEWALAIDNKISIFLLLAMLMIVIHRIFYWLPVHTDMAKFTNRLRRGREISLVQATVLVIKAVCPLLAGWLLLRYNYDILFLIAIVVYFCALLPLIVIPRTKERFSWTYAETWKELFSKKRRREMFAYMGDGAEGVVGMIVWPIFIFELLEGNYFEVGALSSLIVVATIIIQLIFGRLTDKFSKRKMLHLGSVLYAAGWIVKIFIVTAFQIFLASTYHSFASIFSRTPFDALTYEKAADQGHFVDEYTVLHEMAINFGKVIMLVFVLTLLLFLDLKWVFVLAAFASLSMNYLASDETISREKLIDSSSE